MAPECAEVVREVSATVVDLLDERARPDKTHDGVVCRGKPAYSLETGFSAAAQMSKNVIRRPRSDEGLFVQSRARHASSELHDETRVFFELREDLSDRSCGPSRTSAHGRALHFATQFSFTQCAPLSEPFRTTGCIRKHEGARGNTDRLHVRVHERSQRERSEETADRIGRVGRRDDRCGRSQLRREGDGLVDARDE